MRAIILAGGRGERLKPLTNETPKPMINLLNRPVIYYIVELLKKHGITKLAFTLGYKPDSIIEYFGDGSKFGVDIMYFLESEPLGTAGGVKNCSPFIDDDFLVVSGDAFTEVDFTSLIDFHYAKNGIATLCATEVKNPTGFGVIKTNEKGLITEFLEKPEHTDERLVNTGIYVFKKDVLMEIPNGFYDFGRNLFPNLLGNLYAFKTNDYWSDVGTIESLYNTNIYLANNLARYFYLI